MLATFTLPAGALARDGDGLRVQTHLAGANDTTLKTVSIKFGGDTVMTQALGAQNSQWSIIATITRNTVSVERYCAQWNYDDGVTFVARTSTAAGAVNLANAVVVTVNGTGTASSKVFHNRTMIEFLPAP